MIIAMGSTISIEGNQDMLIAEASLILNQLYSEMARRYGKEEAEEQLDFIIKIAHMREEEIETLAKADNTVFEN